MENATVHCGCGRTMFLDSRHGRGAFRCGCGIRIRIEEAKVNLNRCVMPLADAAACRMPPITRDPLPLCEEHFESSGLKQYQGWCEARPEDIAIDIHALRSRAYERATTDPDFEPDDLIGRIELRHAKALTAFYDLSDAQRRRAKQKEAQAELDGIVYFIGIEKLIKIGKTMKLGKRLSSFSYPNIKVLATEPGYTIREAQLHDKFQGLRVRGEWFRAESPLLEYIAALPKRRW